MADQADVEMVLVAAIAAAIYPQGTSGPSALGVPVRTYRGWPATEALDGDLAAGVVNVTVFPQAAGQVDTTRWIDSVIHKGMMAPTLTMRAEGDKVTISGSAALGQVAGILADRLAVVHRTASGNTPESVAATLGSHLATQRAVQVAGNIVTVPGAVLLLARVVADQPVLRELRRQRQDFRVTCWCPDPVTRDATGRLVDAALSAGTFLDLPDGTVGRIRFVSSALYDENREAALYRRDLVYSVEYAATALELNPSMIFGNATFAAAEGGVIQNMLS